MKITQRLGQLIARFRYPNSLPEEVGSALGIKTSNLVSFETFFETLTNLKQTKLNKFMTRDQAESAFKTACIRERFCHHTLCSYFFNEGCLEFVLHFDQEARLRRAYLLHKQIKSDEGLEIPLERNLPEPSC